MGLLDDAIREHLELKRQHGADAGEIARQEHEALGPVRREDLAVPATPAGAPAPVLDDGYEYVDEDEWVEDDAAVEEAPAVFTPEPAAAAPPAPEPVAEVPPAPAPPAPAPPESGQPTIAFSLDELEAAGAASADAPPITPAAPQPPVPTQDLSWDQPATPAPAAPPADVAEDVVPADAEPGEHDELEETPEFLQETPEHDRLWFEQKPPRDFDF